MSSTSWGGSTSDQDDANPTVRHPASASPIEMTLVRVEYVWAEDSGSLFLNRKSLRCGHALG